MSNIPVDNLAKEVLVEHVQKHYQHKGRNLNDDDVLPVSRILRAMEDYGYRLMQEQSDAAIESIADDIDEFNLSDTSMVEFKNQLQEKYLIIQKQI